MIKNIVLLVRIESQVLLLECFVLMLIICQGITALPSCLFCPFHVFDVIGLILLHNSKSQQSVSTLALIDILFCSNYLFLPHLSCPVALFADVI